MYSERDGRGTLIFLRFLILPALAGNWEIQSACIGHWTILPLVSE